MPLTRNPIRSDAPPPLAEQASAGLERVLRQAAARGASTLYLSSGARPSIRVDGDVETLDGAPVLGPNDVESLLLTLMPERDAEALRTGAASEWICEIADLGRVRCMTFRDSRGPGGVFRLMRPRGITAEQLGLSREIQALAVEPGGLVLVAGPRSSGKRTLISAFVDLINKQRRDHVITIESEINVVHERVGALVSQREARGGADEMLAEARAALREDPDVLVLENVRTPDLMNLALDAAATRTPGHRRLCGPERQRRHRPDHRPVSAEQRRQVQLSLAQNLRGVVAQVLLKKRGGGRVAAREVLLNTPAVAACSPKARPRSCRSRSKADASTAWCRSTTRSSGSCRAAPSMCAKPTACRGSGRLPRAAETSGPRHVGAREATPNRLRRLSGLPLHERLSSSSRNSSTCSSVSSRIAGPPIGRSLSTTRRPRARRLWPTITGCSPEVSSDTSM